MTLREHIASLDKKILFLILIAAPLRFYRIGEMFSFDYDQEIAANAAYEFIKNGKIPLIGQELSFPGFFLGPIHNLIQILPYSACNLKPDCIPYFFVIIGILTTFLLYQIVKKLFSRKSATIASAIHAVSFVIIGNERGPSSNYFLFLTSIFMLYCTFKYLNGKGYFLVLGGFIGGLAVVNFNPVFIFTLIAYFTYSLLAKRKDIKLLVLSLSAALINLIPLILFNLRHDNILFKNFLIFFNQSSSSQGVIERIYFNFWHILIPYYTNFLFLTNGLIYRVLTVLILTSAIYALLKKDNRIGRLIVLSIVVPFIGLSFYKRPIPDYYFFQTIPAFILLIAIYLSRRFYLFLFFATLFLFANLNMLFFYRPGISYSLKKTVVNYIIQDSGSDSFNVYFNLPVGLNTGYNYLFKAYGKLPQENFINLYIIDSANDFGAAQFNYSRTFSDKQISYKFIGPINIVKIK